MIYIMEVADGAAAAAALLLSLLCIPDELTNQPPSDPVLNI